MPQDQYGNYVAGLADNVDWVTPQSGTPVQVGSGAPTVNTPISPLYLDSVSGILYSNPTLTAGAWVVASGSGGSTQVLSTNDANPNTAAILPADQTKAAIWYQKPTTTVFNVWWWDTGDKTWHQYSAP